MKLKDENFFQTMYNFLQNGIIPQEIANTWKESNLRRDSHSYYILQENLYKKSNSRSIAVETVGDRIENSIVTERNHRDSENDIKIIYWKDLENKVKDVHEQYNHRTGQYMLLNLFKNIQCYGQKTKTEIIKENTICNECEPVKTKKVDHSIVAVEAKPPGVRYEIDLSFFRSKIILSMVESFSKKVWSNLVQSKESVNVVNFLRDFKTNVLDTVNLPPSFTVELQSDNGGEFISIIISNLISEFG